MKRALELVEPLPAKLDPSTSSGSSRATSRDEDCFAKFDEVFDSLASQLDWGGAPEKAGKVERPEPASALVAVAPVTAPQPETPRHEPLDGDALRQYEHAFSMLDNQLARTNPPQMPAPPEKRRHSVKTLTPTLLKPKRARRAARSFEDVFGVLENLSIVRRRGGFSEERQLIGRLLADARRMCADLDLQTARVRVEFAVMTLENGQFERLTSEIDELARHIRHDLRFCSIGPGKKY